MDLASLSWKDVWFSARDNVARTVVPIFGTEDIQSLLGSGFLIRQVEEDFLITAGHVLQECLPEIHNGESISTGWIYKTSRQAIGIGGGITISKPGSKVHDLGIVRLHDKFDPSPDVVVLNRRQVELDLESPASAICIVVGFPLSRSKTRQSIKRSDAKLHPILTVLADEKAYQDLGLNRSNSLLLKHQNVDERGRKLVDPIGMSGCPVWFVALREGELVWTLRGMLVERLQKRTVLRCIPIEVILDQMDLTPPRKLQSNGRLTI